MCDGIVHDIDYSAVEELSYRGYGSLFYRQKASAVRARGQI